MEDEIANTHMADREYAKHIAWQEMLLNAQLSKRDKPPAPVER
jgi:hypothetical protein